MEYRISELLNGYDAQNVGIEANSGLDLGRIERMTMAKCAKQDRSSIKRSVRMGLIAAAAALLLGAAAVAAYGWSLGDRVVESAPVQEDYRGESMAQFSAVGGAPEDTAETATEPEASEYLALEEWTEYYFSDHDVASYEPLAEDDMVGEIYVIGYREMKQELERIAEKYGLRLMQGETLYTGADVYNALDVASLVRWPIASSEYGTGASHAMLYDDGSFRLQMYVDMPEGVSDGTMEELFFRLHCAKKGTLYTATEGGGDPANYRTESYTTADGIELQLALGTNDSMIFAERDDCYVTIHISGGYEPGEYLPYLDMADMQQLADGFDLTQLG